MRHLALIFLLCGGALAEAEAPDWAVGAQVTAHLQRQVNPDFTQAFAEPVVFGKIRFHPWVALLEFGYQLPRSSSSGDLSIRSQTVDLALWAHYEFDEPGEWTPYLGAGVGEYFDRVDTSFADGSDTSTAARFRVGAALGLSKSFSWFLMEAEARGELVEWSARPELSALLRFGVRF